MPRMCPPKTYEESSSLTRRLAKAVLQFQDRFMDLRVHSGSLCQVWLCDTNEAAAAPLLRTKGLPFCVSGIGDLLALFRCISCRYTFSTDALSAGLLGAPGRVVTTGEPEMSSNVQHHPKEVYLRTSEAVQCRVQSTILVPIFLDPLRESIVGALEVVQTAEDMPFDFVISSLAEIMPECGLYTSSPQGSRCKGMAESSDTVRDIARRNSLLSMSSVESGSNQARGEATATSHSAQARSRPVSKPQPTGPTDSSFSPGSPDANKLSPPRTCLDKLSIGAGAEAQTKQESGQWSHPGVQQHQQFQHQQQATLAAAGSSQAHTIPITQPQLGHVAPLAKAVADSGAFPDSVWPQSPVGPLSQDGGQWDDEGDDLCDGDDDGSMGGKRSGKGSGNPGKPGKRLQLTDLQSQFGVGLKEAANRLGICPTTLKRACRRHGIQRWPRRQLLKLSRAIDQINQTTTDPTPTPTRRPEGEQAQPVAQSQAQQPPAQQPDGRWSHLAQLIPGLHCQSSSEQGTEPWGSAEESKPGDLEGTQHSVMSRSSGGPGRCHNSGALEPHASHDRLDSVPLMEEHGSFPNANQPNGYKPLPQRQGPKPLTPSSTLPQGSWQQHNLTSTSQVPDSIPLLQDSGQLAAGSMPGSSWPALPSQHGPHSFPQHPSSFPPHPSSLHQIPENLPHQLPIDALSHQHLPDVPDLSFPLIPEGGQAQLPGGAFGARQHSSSSGLPEGVDWLQLAQYSTEPQQLKASHPAPSYSMHAAAMGSPAPMQLPSFAASLPNNALPHQPASLPESGPLNMPGLGNSVNLHPERQQYGFNLHMDAPMEDDDMDVGMMHPSVLDLLLAPSNV